MISCYIGLGSNLEDPLQHILEAFEQLSQLPNTQLIARSSLYQSKAVGPGQQRDYINAVAKLHTELEPLTLLDQLQHIEQAHGRERLEHWGPRTLDLDLLIYGHQIIDHPRLQVPHPRIAERNFVLYPLHELSPGLKLADDRELQVLYSKSSHQHLSKLPPSNQDTEQK